MTKTGNLPPPTTIALVLCDNVYRATNGKQALVGLFNKIVASTFPAVQPRMCAFVSITSVRPTTNISLEIINAETDEQVICVKGPAPSGPPPTTVWDLVFELPPLTFPTPGRYYVRFIGNNDVLAERPFDVVPAEGKNNANNDENDHS